MRILFLSAWYPMPPDNGSKIRVYHLLRSLAVRHEVSLVSFSFGASGAESKEVLISDLAQVSTVNANPFDRVQTAGPLRFLFLAPVAARPLSGMARLVSDTLDRTSFDVIIASTGTVATYVPTKVPGPVKVLEEHNSLARWMHERYQAQTNALQRLRCRVSWQKARRYEAHLYKQFNLCTVVSEQDRAAALELLPASGGLLKVVPNGVDCAANATGSAEPLPNTLVYNGALTYDANYDAMQFYLSEVHHLVREQEPGVKLTITGSILDVELAGLKLDSSVHLSGHVPDVRLLVAQAWICIAPIRQGGGTRLKILEAMALGTPVVSTTKGAEGLALTPGRDILIADTPSSFATQVLRLLSDSSLRHTIAANARRLVEAHYDWAAIGQRFVGLVEAAAKENRG